MMPPRYHRVMLKLSGEVLGGVEGQGLSIAHLDQICSDIAETIHLGVQLGITVGGGNVLRGCDAIQALGLERICADHMGMLGTVINALALREHLQQRGIDARLMTAIPIQSIAEPFAGSTARSYLEAGCCVICAYGTGWPYLTTDTAAALYAAQTGAEAILKGTKVDGIYSDDPARNPDAVRYTDLTYADVLKMRLKVMDATAVAFCMENDLSIVVFNVVRKRELVRVVKGEHVGTLVAESV